MFRIEKVLEGMKKMLSRIKTLNKRDLKFFHIINFIFLGLVTNHWFREGKLIGNVDIYYGVDKFGEFIQRFSNYSSIRSGGQNYAAQVPASAVTFVNGLINLFIQNPLTSQKVFFLMANASIFYSIYYFLIQLLRIEGVKKNSWIIIFVCYIITFNPYLAFVWVRLQNNLFSLSWIFLSLGILFSTIKSQELTKKNLTYFALLSFFTGWTNGVQPPIFQIWIYTFLILALYYSIRLKQFYLTLVFIFKCSLIFIITNLWWIYPFLNYVLSNNLNNNENLSAQYNVYELITGTSKHLSLINLTHFIGDFAWFEDYLPDIFPFRSSPFYLLINSIQFVLILSYIVVISCCDKYKKYENGDRFWLAALIAFLMLSAGSHPPFGSIYLYFSDHIYALGLQRAPWQKFTMFLLLPLSFLTYRAIQFAFIFAQQHFRDLTKKYSLTILISLLIPISFLTLSGHMFNLGVGNYGFHETNNFGFHLAEPKYVQDSIQFLNMQIEKDYGDILLLPASKTQAYDWGYGAPVDVIVTSSIKAGVITPEYGEGTNSRMDIQTFNDQMLQFLETGKLKDFLNLANQRNIKYIINRRDFNLKFYSGKNRPDSVNLYTDMLISSAKVELLQRFGKWDILKVNDSNNLVENIDGFRNDIEPRLIKSDSMNFRRILPSVIIISTNDKVQTIKLNEYRDSGWRALILNTKNSFKIIKDKKVNQKSVNSFGNEFLVNDIVKIIVLFYYPTFITYLLLFIAVIYVSIAIMKLRTTRGY